MNKIKVGVIPAAGSGKRMGYLGQVLHKSLFPLGDRPIIHYIINHMEKIGVEDVYVIVHYQKEKIKSYFESVKENLNSNIHFIEQEKLAGIASAINLTKEFINEPFMTSLGDDCTITKSFSNLVDTFYTNDAIVVEGVVKENNKEVIQRTNCLELDSLGRIKNIIEKPIEPISDLRGCGLYVFSPQIFDYIKKTPISSVRHEIEITDTIGLVAKDGRAYGAYINGENININTQDDLLNAWLELKKLNIK